MIGRDDNLNYNPILEQTENNLIQIKRKRLNAATMVLTLADSEMLTFDKDNNTYLPLTADKAKQTDILQKPEHLINDDFSQYLTEKS